MDARHAKLLLPGTVVMLNHDSTETGIVCQVSGHCISINWAGASGPIKYHHYTDLINVFDWQPAPDDQLEDGSSLTLFMACPPQPDQMPDTHLEAAYDNDPGDI